MDFAALCGARLLACAEAVRPGSAVADIGTDHGYLACYLVGTGRSPRAWATDLREGPLARARAQIARCGLESRIETRLTDGLVGLPLDELDDIVIAGMGGELIAAILAANPGARDGRLRFVLQPMTRPETLRRALCEQGFSLEAERGVSEHGFAYPVMTARHTGERVEADELFAWTGRLPQSDHPDSAAMLRETLRRLEKKAAGMRRSTRDRAEAARWTALAGQVADMLDEIDRKGQATR